MVQGSCLCGALEYELTEPVTQLLHCHCSRCRKHHAAPFASFALAPVEGLRWRHGEPSLITHQAPSGRVRSSCSTCGAVAPVVLGDKVLVPVGNLLGDCELPRASHMCAASKAVWHSMASGLMEHADVSPEWPLASAAGSPAWAEVSRHENAPPESPGGAQSQGGQEEEAQGQVSASGGCLCGAVRFAVSGAPSRWFQCHCSRCRRGRSAVHGSNTFYPVAQLRWLAGKELVRSYKLPEAERFTLSFCQRCGGGAPVVREGLPFVVVPAGLFDGDPGARPQAHIFVGSKLPWYELSDGSPQHEALPPL